ncbi:craniofacial development protein 2-like [Schistocerca americana]|uniref:craniofacial development protein 2-like n=1 Tax=Schistocerca americana TaxID=7009 RepID=UPI001F4FEFD1|nr:craniofacial development protein 2-like [Schistocerca americana]
MDFESELENHIESANIVMGVFNAQIGKDSKGFEQVLGCFGYGGRNEDGERLLDLCQRNRMKIANNWFVKGEGHVITRYSWDERTKSVIDYILVDRERGEKVTNVKVIPSGAGPERPAGRLAVAASSPPGLSRAGRGQRSAAHSAADQADTSMARTPLSRA